MLNEFLSIFTEVGNITSLMTFAVTILGALSLLLVNLGRYFQSKKFGIPLRNVHQANIAESAELWIALAGSLGFGLFVPFIMLSVGWSLWLIMPVMFVSFIMGFIMTKGSHSYWGHKTITRDGKEYRVEIDMTLIFYAVRSLLAALGYARLHQVYYDMFVAEEAASYGFFSITVTVFSTILLLYYFFQLMMQLYTSVVGRLFGNIELSVTTINGQKYFVAMRHNQDKWFLMEYELEEYRKVFRLGMFKRNFYSSTSLTIVAKFTKDTYIIRDLSELTEPLKRIAVSRVINKERRGRFTYESEVVRSADMDEEGVVQPADMDEESSE